MKLKYRGVTYEYNPTKVATIEGKVGGKYRGASWQKRIPQITLVDEPNVDLKYRGVSYSKGAVKLTNLEVEPLKVQVTHPEMLPEEPTLSPEKQKVKH